MWRWLAPLLAIFPSAALASGKSEQIIIIGVVDALGATAGKDGNGSGTQWFGSVHLVAWRIGDGPVRTDQLRIESPLGFEDEATQKFMSKFKSGQVVRLRIAAVPELWGLGLKAELHSIVDYPEDSELLATADPILNPPDFVDPELGRFVADKRLPDSFEGKTQWQGREIAIRLNVEKNAELEQLAQSAKKLLSDSDKWDSAAKAKIIEKLYPLWKDTWATQDNQGLNTDEFYARMKLSGIDFHGNEYFELEFSDDDLFWGHWVMVVGTLLDGIEDANIAG